MGKVAKDGDEYTAANGYRYRRVQGRFRLLHHLIAEGQLGRPLLPNEGVYFVDGDRSNLDPGNVGVRIKGGSKQRNRLAAIDEQIRELEAEREIILKDLASKTQA